MVGVAGADLVANAVLVTVGRHQAVAFLKPEHEAPETVNTQRASDP